MAAFIVSMSGASPPRPCSTIPSNPPRDARAFRRRRLDGRVGCIRPTESSRSRAVRDPVPSWGFPDVLPFLRSQPRLRASRSSPASPPRLSAPPPKAVRAALLAARADLEPDNICSSRAGPACMDVVRQLKDAGTWVIVLQRKNDDRAEIEKMGAFLSKGDALNLKDVQKAYDMVEEYDAVVHRRRDPGGPPRTPRETSTSSSSRRRREGEEQPHAQVRAGHLHRHGRL